jgi:hypothetical protein
MYPPVEIGPTAPSEKLALPNATARAQEDARDLHAHGTAGQFGIDCQVQDQDPGQKEASREASTGLNLWTSPWPEVGMVRVDGSRWALGSNGWAKSEI